MREFLNLASNPLFVKHIRSRLRRAAVVPGLVIVVFLSLCIVGATYQFRQIGEPLSDGGSQVFFWLQGFVLVLLGGSQVAGAIAQMKESGIIDFHRITPVPPAVQTIGIMVGAPIRELILYAATLPFALWLAIDGPIGITNFCKLLLVQLGGALMYFSLAMITGLAGGKARGASGRFVGILAGLNIMASSFYGLGIYGPTLITSMPVYHEVFLDDDAPGNRQRQAQRRALAQQRAAQQQQWQQQQMQQQKQFGGPNQPGGPNQQFGPNQPQQIPPDPKRPPVTFYGAPVPLVFQSLLFQSCLLTFLFIGASRRIHSARIPLYSKPIALAFLSTIAVLTLGSLWDSPTFILTLGLVYFLTFCTLILTNPVTPTLGDLVKGMQRAQKLSGSKVPIWSDLASNKFVVFFYALAITAVTAVGILLAPQPPALGFIQLRHVFSPWPALLVGVLAIFSYAFASQYLHAAYGRRARGMVVLFIFFAWITPIIIGMIVIAADVDGGGYLLAVSPFVGIASAGLFRIGDLDQTTIMVASIAPVAIYSIVFFTLLLNYERKLHADVMDEHSVRRRRRQDRMDEYEAEFKE